MARLLDGRRVLLGVSGGIAAYKTPELVRRLQDAGASVRAILTDAACRFVSPLALEVVSTADVGTSLWDTDAGHRIVHTDVGQDADLILLAPATADLIGRIRHGLAPDLLTTAVMACATPVLVCPSMNTDMLANPMVRANIDALGADPRYTVLEPGRGLLACGVDGPGRLPDPPAIIEAAAAALRPKALLGLRVVVTAGPTREAVDPVRFVTNHSTGTMGFELARAFAAAGAEVTLVAGPVSRSTPVGVRRRVDVVTAAELAAATHAALDHADVLVMAAAVADYRPSVVAEAKITKGHGPLTLTMERTDDVLEAVAARADRAQTCVIGFAAETHDVLDRGRAKLARKGMDHIVINDVSVAGLGFGTGDNAVTVAGADGSERTFSRMDKALLADRLVDHWVPSLRAGDG